MAGGDEADTGVDLSSVAKVKGRQAIETVRDRLAERAGAILQEHPGFAAGAAEIGLVDREWLENPSGPPVRSASTVEMVHRFLERSVEREPSLIAKLGLNAIDLLNLSSDGEDDPGAPQTVAIVFTDLEDFTAYTAEVGDAAARDYLEQHHRLVGPVIRSRGGRVVKRIGDGLLLVFTAAEAAVLAALEIEALDHGALRLRAGIHHGEVVPLGDDIVGNDVNLAARVADSAAGGEVLATASVRDAVTDLPTVEFGDATARTFKGIDTAVDVMAVRWATT